jgi:hypothetical protein
MNAVHGGAEVMSSQSYPEPQLPIDDPAEQLKALLTRAQGGDLTVLPELRDTLDRYPQIWKNIGDLGKTAENALLAAIAKKDLATTEAIRKYSEKLRAELGGLTASPLEQLLIDRLLLDWLAVCAFGILATEELALVQDPFGLVREGYVRREEAAHRRFLRSAKVLAEVRRLLGNALSPKQEPLSCETISAVQRLRVAGA